MKLKIRELPRTDLNFRYAVEDENGRIRHYYAPYQYVLSEDKVDPLQALKDRLLGDNGTEIEVIEIKPGNGNFVYTPVDLSLFDKEAQKALKKMLKVKSSGVLFQEVVRFPFLQYWSRRFRNIVAAVINGASNIVANILLKIGVLKVEEFVLLTKGGKRVSLPRIDYMETEEAMRYYHAATYLALTVEEEKLQEAINLIGEDLKTLNGKGEIIGHFIMPAVINSSNMTGNGKKVYTVFTSVILDSRLTNNDYRLRPELRTQVFEGGTTYLNGKVPYSDLVDGEPVNLLENLERRDLELIEKAGQGLGKAKVRDNK